MIFGIGTDIVDVKRIKKMKSPSAFANKILGDQELKKFAEMKEGRNHSYLGKQFAAKEAFSKALGTGFRKGLNFKDIEIVNDNLNVSSLIFDNSSVSSSISVGSEWEYYFTLEALNTTDSWEELGETFILQYSLYLSLIHI